MPELPEVEVVRAGLEPAVVGARIVAVDARDPRALTRHTGDAASFERALTGRTITAAARRGKFLWLPLSASAQAGARGPREAVVAHLGMSGQLLLRAPGAPDERHERVRLHIQHPSHGEIDVVFSDQRTFGSLAVDTLVPTPDGAAGGWGTDAAAIPSQVAHIARDALDPAVDDRAVIAAVRAKRSAIKRVLLDQTVLSGIGNIYADEALWAARIHPRDPRRRAVGAGGGAPARRCARGAAEGAGRGRHELRRAVRECQRSGRLLRALAERVRTHVAAVPSLRHADRPRVVHQPLESLLPALSAAPVTVHLTTAPSSTRPRTRRGRSRSPR